MDLHRDIRNEKHGYYFESYSELAGHEILIRDGTRTITYQRAIEMNAHLFEGKIVLDVGCGSGILSLFAARAGAKTVIGIDASEVAIHAKKIAEVNKFSNIVIVQSKVEDLQELPLGIEKVDIIISEWMGYCLYHESMLATVLFARDKWLKKKGLIFPDKVQLYLAAVDDRSKIDSIEKWNFMANCDMSVMKNILYEEARVMTIEPQKILTDYYPLHEFDLNTAASSNFSFTTTYQLTARNDGRVYGFVTYFDAIFSKCHKVLTLSTSPASYPTHWRQTFFPFKESMTVKKGNEITGAFTLAPSPHNFRDLFFRINRCAVTPTVTYRSTSDYTLR